VDLGFLKGGVEASAKAALGREIKIDGPVVFEFSDWPAIEIQNVYVANVPDAFQPVFLKAGYARLQIGLFPLLKGDIQIGEITAENVILNLENDAQGQPNWIFETEQDGTPGPTPTGNTPEMIPAEADKKYISFGGLHNLALKKIAASYHDASLNKTIHFKLDRLDGEASPGKPIKLDFTGNVQKNSYDFQFQGDSIGKLLSGGEEPWQFKLAGNVAGKKIMAEGDMAMRDNEPAANLEFEIMDIDVGDILSRLELVEGLKASTGSMGIKLALKGNSLDKIVRNSSMSFSLRDGQWRIASPTSEAFLDVEKLTGDILVEQGNEVMIKLVGMVDKFPVKIVITGAPLVEYVSVPETVPLTIDVEFADSYLSFGGELALPVTDRDLNLFLKFKTDQLDNLNEVLRLDLPPIGPVELSTRFKLLDTRYELSKLDLQVGQSRLAGKMSLDSSEEKPVADIELISELLRIDDFDAMKKISENSLVTQPAVSEETEKVDEAAIGETEKQGEDDERDLLSLDVLSSFNAELLVKAKKVTSGDDDLGSGEMKVTLKDGLLALAPLRIDVPGGIVQVGLDYLPTEENITLNLNADIDKFDIGVLVRRAKPDAKMGGMIYMNAALHSTAPDFSTAMENAEGHFDFGLVPQNFSAGIIDMWAVNLISSIMTEVSEEEQSEINCVVVRFGIEDGLMEEKAIYMDTSNMYIAGKAGINFKTRKLSIVLVPKAKKPEFFSLAVPIKVQGKFDDFGFGIGLGRLTGAIFSFITSPVHVPLRKIFADKIPEDGQEACRQAWALTGKEVEKSVQ